MQLHARRHRPCPGPGIPQARRVSNPSSSDHPLDRWLTLAAGLHVIATARNPDVLEDMAAQGMSTLPLDVTSQESIAACKAEVEKITNGRLDILVNNA